MPWNGDQYQYTKGLIRALIRNLKELQMAVMDCGDPDTETAAMVWDLEEAMSRAGLSRRQKRVLELYGSGLEPFHIAFLLGASTGSVYSHLGRAGKKLENFLNGCRVDTPREGYIG